MPLSFREVPCGDSQPSSYSADSILAMPGPSAENLCEKSSKKALKKSPEKKLDRPVGLDNIQMCLASNGDT
jgi:hypothetical protein